MPDLRKWINCLFFVLLMTCVASCATSTGNKTDKLPSTEEVDGSVLTEGELVTARLRGKLRGMTEVAKMLQESRSGTVLDRPPYYFKMFRLYPDDISEAPIDLTKQDSFLTPYRARVNIPVSIFRTDYYEDEESARKAAIMLRQSGMSRQTFEYVNGDWTLVSEVFVQNQLCERKDGEWTEIPVRESK
ncbi:hypothetical protein ACFL1X_00230 [Candidatus Hydrogenedentota bacterium]